MATRNKTQANQSSATDFLKRIDDPIKQQDAITLDNMLRKVSQHKPVMWGSSIVGYGSYHYRYESGREGDFMRIGFAPRKQNLAIYIMPGFANYTNTLDTLGKHKTGKCCLYVKRLDDIHMDVLQALCERAWEDMAKAYPLLS